MIDGNWVDMASLISAFLGIFIKPMIRLARGTKPHFIYREVNNDAMNAATLFTFTLLFLSVFSSFLLAALLSSTKVSLGVAGLVGIFYLIREITSV